MYALAMFLDDLQNNFKIHMFFLLLLFVFTTFCKLYSNRCCGPVLARRFDTTVFYSYCLEFH